MGYNEGFDEEQPWGDFDDQPKNSRNLSFTPSHLQEAVFEFIEMEDGSAIIEAVAGSGKTWTIVEALKCIPPSDSVLFLAFNKAIADELQKRVGGLAQCKTTHALGYGGIISSLGPFKVDNDKVKDHALTIISEELDLSMAKVLWYPVSQMIQQAKNLGLVVEDESRRFDLEPLVPDEPESWDQIIDFLDLEMKRARAQLSKEEVQEVLEQLVDEAVDGGMERWKVNERLSVFELRAEDIVLRNILTRMARLVMRVSVRQTDVIDYSDMLYLAALCPQVSMRKFDFVFIDEAQDISAIQRQIISKVLKRDRNRRGRLIAVGDPRQAIYAFRGADSTSLSKIEEQFKCTRLPLSITYRCAVSIVEEARNIVDHIEPKQGAEEGLVERIATKFSPAMFKSKDLIICRMNFPLLAVAFDLAAAGFPFTYKARDFIDKLIKKIETISNPNDSMQVFQTKFKAWEKEERERLEATGKEHQIEKFNELVKSIERVHSVFGGKVADIYGLVSLLKKSFYGSRSDAVILSTVHRAKGLEAENVFILDEFLFNPREVEGQVAWKSEQLRNLKYVAITRAKRNLTYVESGVFKRD